MEARRFRCEECGTGFTVPPEALEKFPNWRPKRCRACRSQSRPEVRADRARPASSAASAEIYAEGSCEPNPGDGGWAAVKVAGGRIVREASGFEPSTTNNRMELMALVEGLKMTAPDEEAVIWTASEFCFKTATVWAPAWSRNGWRKADHKPVANGDLVRQIFALLQERPRVRVEWRQGSDGGPWNACASAVAKARRSGNVPPAAPSLAGAARV